MDVSSASLALQPWPELDGPQAGPARLEATSQSIGAIAGVPTALFVSSRAELSQLVDRLQTGMTIGLPGLFDSDLAAQLASTLRERLAEQSNLAEVLHLNISNDRLVALLG
jgi:hypothetical protein